MGCFAPFRRGDEATLSVTSHLGLPSADARALPMTSSNSEGHGSRRNATTTSTRQSAPTTTTCKSNPRGTRTAMATARHLAATAGRRRAASTCGTTRAPRLCTTRRFSSGSSTTTCSTRLGCHRWFLASSGTTSGLHLEAASPILSAP